MMPEVPEAWKIKNREVQLQYQGKTYDAVNKVGPWEVGLKWLELAAYCRVDHLEGWVRVSRCS